MKKIISALLSAAMLFAVGCTSTTTTKAPTNGETTKAADKKDGLKPETIEVQLIPSKDAAKLDAQRKPLQDLLEKELGQKVNVTVATEYAGLIEGMKSKKIHVGFLAPASYVLASKEKAAEVILVSTRYDVDDMGKKLKDKPLVSTYKSQLVVGKDSGIKSVKDLKGKKIAIASFTSTSGFLYPANLLADNGLDPEKDVQWQEVGGHDKAIMAVLNGQADAAFTFKDARDLLVNTNPDVREKVVYIADTEAIQNDTISVIPDLDADLKNKIKQAFINIGKDENGRKIMQEIYSHEGYLEAKDSDFDKIREYLQRQEKWEIGK